MVQLVTPLAKDAQFDAVRMPPHSIEAEQSVLGGLLLATCGLLAGIWADKFDQVATVQNFLILPLTYLSGVFYSIHSLPQGWQALSRANPFFYLIDGFRYAFFGHSDVSPWLSAAVMAGANLALCLLCLRLLARGYKLRG